MEKLDKTFSLFDSAQVLSARPVLQHRKSSLPNLRTVHLRLHPSLAFVTRLALSGVALLVYSAAKLISRFMADLRPNRRRQRRWPPPRPCWPLKDLSARALNTQRALQFAGCLFTTNTCAHACVLHVCFVNLKSIHLSQRCMLPVDGFTLWTDSIGLEHTCARTQ